jgi:hypothetical protein
MSMPNGALLYLIGQFRQWQFAWRSEHHFSMTHTLTDAELRDCLDDFYSNIKHVLVWRGKPLSEDDHAKLKGALVKKIMGPTKRMW